MEKPTGEGLYHTGIDEHAVGATACGEDPVQSLQDLCKYTKYEEYAYGVYEVVEYGIHRKLYEGP